MECDNHLPRTEKQTQQGAAATCRGLRAGAIRRGLGLLALSSGSRQQDASLGKLQGVNGPLFHLRTALELSGTLNELVSNLRQKT
jgi:hypothetical protein